MSEIINLVLKWTTWQANDKPDVCNEILCIYQIQNYTLPMHFGHLCIALCTLRAVMEIHMYIL